jgi:hypothetical protein
VSRSTLGYESKVALKAEFKRTISTISPTIAIS